MPKPTRYHHYLVSGLLLIRGDEDEQMSQINLNTMVRSDVKNIPVRLIGKAQQSLQMTLHQRMQSEQNAPAYQVVDAVILNMVYCGFMSEVEFNATPSAELKLRDSASAADAPDPFKSGPLTQQ